MNQKNRDFIEDVELLKSKRIIKKDIEIAEQTGFDKSVISNYLSGRVKPSENFLSKFNEVFSSQLSKNKIDEPSTPQGGGNIIYVPLVAYGGFLQGYSSKVFLDQLLRFTLPGVNGEHYAFEVDGMSMFDLAAPGDTAIAKLEEKLEWMIKGKTYVLQTTDGILIKLYEGIKGEKATFNSYNQEYRPIDIPLKSIKRVYFVTRILKKI